MVNVRWQIKNLILFVIAFVFMFMNTSLTFAGPNRTTYQAKIIKPDGFPLEAVNVNFKFTILDPAGACILYAETYSSVNMSGTGGLISFALGSGVKTYPVSATTFEQVFSNVTSSLSCDTGGPVSYSPLAADTRKIVMQFHDGAGWQTLPAMNINAVPYAMYANEAQKISGLPSCNLGEALSYNGVGFTCETISGGGSVTSSTITAALGYTPADDVNVSAITSNISNVSTTVFSVSSTVASLSTSVSTLTSTVAASFSAITSSQWLSMVLQLVILLVLLVLVRPSRLQSCIWLTVLRQISFWMDRQIHRVHQGTQHVNHAALSLLRPRFCKTITLELLAPEGTDQLDILQRQKG